MCACCKGLAQNFMLRKSLRKCCASNTCLLAKHVLSLLLPCDQEDNLQQFFGKSMPFFLGAFFDTA